MKKCVCGILTVMLIIVNITLIWGNAAPNKNQIEDYLDCVSCHELNTIKNPSYGSVGGEWAVMALARYGTVTDSYLSVYKANLKKHLKACDGVLSTKKYTEYARVVIALTAIEENPKNFGGYNLLKPLAELEKVVSQGANGVIYTLIALDCGHYDIPEPDKSYDGKKTTRESLVSMIVDNQQKDGGWTFMGTKSDTDMTAMSIQALAPYYHKEDKVKKAVDKGLKRLGELQQKDGGYMSGGFANCESTAQVLTALSVMNISIHDDRFVKNNHTVIDGLMKHYKNGGFSHLVGYDVNQMATEQAMYALTAYYRSISGMNGLFEMKDGITKRVLKPLETAENNSDSITKSSKKSKTSKRKNSKKISEAVTENTDKNVKNKIDKVTENKTETVKETKTSEEKTTKKESKKTKEENVTVTETSVQGENNSPVADKNEDHKTNQKISSEGVVIFVVVILAGSAGYFIYKRSKRKKENAG